MTNKKDLKAFVRYDGSGRVVAGSLILRRKKPKVGKWTEIQGYQCCNQAQQTIEVSVETSFPFSYPDFVLESNDSSPYMYFFNGASNVTVNNLAELAAYNNSRYHNLGSFTVTDGGLLFTPNANTAAMFAANGTTILAAYSFAD